MKKDSKIFVAGHKGLVGSAIVRNLERFGYTNIITMSRDKLDLRSKESVRSFFGVHRPEYIFIAAAKVGGILSNKNFPADYLMENLQIQSNILEMARIFSAKKLLFLGSSCIYPRDAQQPIREEYLMTGPLEDTNRAYAIAKIAGIEMCRAYRDQHGCNFISAMPCNLYGPNDYFNKINAHVIPALMSKFHHATISNERAVELYGDGSPLREFLHSDDLARALIILMLEYNSPEPINIGSGVEISIKELAEKLSSIIGYKGNIEFRSEFPNGTPRKVLDSSKMRSMGWSPEISIEDGLSNIYHWYLRNQDKVRI